MEQKELYSKKALILLVLPLLIDQLLGVMTGIADTFMVSVVGEEAVSGVSLVDTINVLFITVFGGLSTGGAVICARLIGQGKKEKVLKAANQLILSTVTIAVGIMILCLIFNKDILTLIFGSVSDGVINNAVIYFIIVTLSFPFLASYYACTALFRAMGNSRLPMLVSLIMNGINVIGNGVLLYGFHMGVAGVAIPTLVSRIIASVIMLYFLRQEKYLINISKFSFRVDWHMIKQILSIGVPNGLEIGIFQIGKILVLSLISSLGTTVITANAIANTISTFAALPEDAIALALLTVVGQCAGANRFDEAKKYTKKLLKVTYCFMWVLNILIIIGAPVIVKFFHLGEDTASVATVLVRFNSCFGLTIWPLAFALPNALRAASDVKYPLVVSFVSMWTFRVFLSYLLVKYASVGILGIYMCYGIDWIVRAIAFTSRFLSGKWITIAKRYNE